MARDNQGTEQFLQSSYRKQTLDQHYHRIVAGFQKINIPLREISPNGVFFMVIDAPVCEDGRILPFYYKVWGMIVFNRKKLYMHFF